MLSGLLTSPACEKAEEQYPSLYTDCHCSDKLDFGNQQLEDMMEQRGIEAVYVVQISESPERYVVANEMENGWELGQPMSAQQYKAVESLATLGGEISLENKCVGTN